MKFLLMILLLVSCGDDDMAKPSKLDRLRVLGIKADKPEVNSSTTVNMSPIISYTNGGGAVLNFNWEACPDFGVFDGEDANCDGVDNLLKDDGSGTFDTSTLSFNTGELTTPIIVNIPAAVIAYLGGFSSEVQYNGLDYLFVLTLENPSTGERLKSLKRIKVSSKVTAELNQNPTISGTIQANGSNITSYPSTTTSLTVSGLSSPETYIVKSSSGDTNLSERLTVSWFSDKGELQYTRTISGEANEFKPGSAVDGVFIVIFRDNRGGLDFHRITP